MSKISTIYDTLETTVTTALPAHDELSNPYFPETTADLGYDKAYGIAFGSGSNIIEDGRRQMRNEEKSQDFIVSITRRIFGTKKDTATRKSVEKSLMEDQRLISNALTSDPTLGGCGLVMKADYLSHDGVEFVRVGRQDIIIVRSLIQIQYHESVV